MEAKMGLEKRTGVKGRSWRKDIINLRVEMLQLAEKTVYT